MICTRSHLVCCEGCMFFLLVLAPKPEDGSLRKVPPACQEHSLCVRGGLPQPKSADTARERCPETSRGHLPH